VMARLAMMVLASVSKTNASTSTIVGIFLCSSLPATGTWNRWKRYSFWIKKYIYFNRKANLGNCR
jgi:D-alanyl-lipoteichoic acid acyltransferase DltB (MBOAT superfamily)